MLTDPKNELFDVVDANDQVIRQETRYNVHKQKLFHRAVHIIVFNKLGEIYLQKRSMNKDTLPGRWTTSCSGHVDAGEIYETAAVREIEEELGIVVASIDAMRELFSHSPIRETGWEFIKVYQLVWDGAITPDPDEISEGRWVTPAKLNEWISVSPKDFAPSFLLVWTEAQSQL